MKPPIALLTDFGTKDVFTGVMKGVITGLAPGFPIVDLSHEVPPQNVLVGALWLHGAVHFFPPGTVFLCVVDPGVGSGRQILAAQVGDWLMVAPDNGLTSLVMERHGLKDCVSVQEPAYRLPSTSATFHGRDIMAPAAAHLAMGLPLHSLGPSLAQPVKLHYPAPLLRNGQIRGQVLYVDHFGNAVTNISGAMLPPGAELRLGALVIKVSGTYSDVPVGAPLALVGSTGRLEISVNRGNAASELGLGEASRVLVTSPMAQHPDTSEGE